METVISSTDVDAKFVKIIAYNNSIQSIDKLCKKTIIFYSLGGEYMLDKEKSFEVNEEIRNFFEEVIGQFSCQDVEFIPAPVNKKWLTKRRFDLDEMINDYKGGEALKEHKILLPHFEDELLPMSGAKYIRSEVQFYAGNVLKYLVEVGELEKIPHNPQHVKYNSQKNNRIFIAMNYQPDKERWGYIREEDWAELKQAVETVQSDERIFQAEQQLKKILKSGRNIIRSFERERTRKELEQFLQLLTKEEYLLFTVPLLWTTFKTIPLKHAKVIEQQTNALYKLWDDVLEDISLYEPNDRIDFTHFRKARTFIQTAQRVFMKGYYIINNGDSVLAFPNIPLIYAIHEQPNSYVKPDYVELWQKKAVQIALKENLQQFLPYDEVMKALSAKKR